MDSTDELGRDMKQACSIHCHGEFIVHDLS